MSVESRGAKWRVRWREDGHARARAFADLADAEAFDRELARRRRGDYITAAGQPCIPLGRGDLVALVDEDMVDDLAQFSWRAVQASRNLYVVRSVTTRRTEAMHRRIMGLEHGDGLEVDHINHDTLDNRRSNLRIVRQIDNQHNRRAVRVYQTPSGRWRGRCNVAHESMWTELFESRADAEAEITAMRRAAQDQAGILLVSTGCPSVSSEVGD